MHVFPLVFVALALLPLIFSSEDEDEDFSALPASTLTPQETCELCQVALRTVYGHFAANIPSKRKLVHQLKHECKRHFNYRRRCLLLMKVNYDMIFREMTDGSFRPMEVCLIMKECKPLDSPLSPEIIDPGQPEAFALVSSSNDNYDSSDD